MRSSGAPLEARAQFLGSAAPGPQSWLWGWQNVNGFPPSALFSVEQVRAFGRRHAVPELIDAEQPLTDTPRVEAGGYAAVASLICGLRPIYTYEVGRGTIGALILEIPGFALPAPTMERTVRVIGEVSGWGGVVDWRRALATYGRLRGLTVADSTDGSDPEALQLVGSGWSLLASVDDLGRLVHVRGRTG